tara:strand:- start:682 stop:1356 length:675 start_codon:yes stop_codon:yes gene_type:complete
MTYDQLVTKIRAYTEVDDTVFTSIIVEGFIEDAEFRIMTDVDLDVFRRNDYSTLTVGNEFLTLPTGILLIRWLETYSSSTGARSTLMQKDVSFIDEYTANRTTTGTPLFYSYWNETKLLLGPTPDVALNVECAYVKRPNTTDGTKLDSSNTTTYLSMNAPNTLLYACLVEAYSFLKDKDMLATYEGRYAQSLRGLGIEQQGRRRRDEYVDGEIRQKLRSVPPSP